MADHRIDAIKTEIEHKKQRIVGSPARIRSEVDHTARQVDDARATLSRVEDQRVALQRRLDVVSKADRDLQAVRGLLEDLEAEIARLKRAAKEVKARQGEADQMHADLAALQGQADHLARSVRRAEERLAELRGNRSVKEEASSRATTALRNELVTVISDTAAARESKRTGDARKAELEAYKEKALQKHAAEMAEMLAGIRQLQRIVGDYHSRLFRSVSEVAAESFAPTSAATVSLLLQQYVAAPTTAQSGATNGNFGALLSQHAYQNTQQSQQPTAMKQFSASALDTSLSMQGAMNTTAGF
jgi:chromosome segregation ATPase